MQIQQLWVQGVITEAGQVTYDPQGIPVLTFGMKWSRNYMTQGRTEKAESLHFVVRKSGKVAGELHRRGLDRRGNRVDVVGQLTSDHAEASADRTQAERTLMVIAETITFYAHR
jgi:primosomal replication protein N